MRILQLCHKPPLPARDGGCIAMNNLTQGLLELGHQVKILTIFTPKHDFNPEELSVSYVENTDIEGVFVDTKINVVDAFTAFMTNDSYHINRFFSSDMDIKLDRLLRKEKFDVVHLESLFMTPYLGTIKRRSAAPVILRAHNIEHTIWEKIAFGTKNKLKKHYLHFLTRQLKEFEINMLNKVDGIATISDSDRMRMLELGVRRPIKTIAFGIHLNEYLPQPTQPLSLNQVVRLFHIGAMDWEPNLEGINWFINKIWPTVRRDFPNVELHLAGRNMPGHYFSKPQDSLFVHGEVPNSIDFMTSHDIMIVPLLSGGGIRVKIIEGMALAKTIISTTIGANGITDGNHPSILIADTKDEWLKHLRELMEDPNLCNQIGKEARTYAASHFDYKLITTQLTDFYTKL
jgi:glycosyltransferase involved in cell wall biosynthesis